MMMLRTYSRLTNVSGQEDKSWNVVNGIKIGVF